MLDTLKELDKDNRIWWGKDGNNVPAIKRFLSEVKQGRVPQTLWPYDEVGHTQEAKKELIASVDFPNSDAVFDTPKPTRLIKRILQLTTLPGEPEDGCGFSGVMEPSPKYLAAALRAPPPDIVLDFFAGSATTAQAVIEQNREDGGNRKVICVQLAEPVMDGLTIADIARARIGKAIREAKNTADLVMSVPANLGFKSFVLAPSNFKQWRGDGMDTPEQLAEQLQMFAKSGKEGATVEDMLYELLLKFGQELTTPIESLDVRGGRVFAIQDRKMLFVLESFTGAMIVPLVEMKPRAIIAVDGVFNDTDMLKTNLDAQCRDAGIRFTCL